MKKETKSLLQSEKFIGAAREHGCDETETAFEEKLGKLAKPKAAPKKKK